MKTLERFAICIWLLIIAYAVCGCQEQLTAQEQLVKSPANWIKKYGDGMESQQTANIVLAIQVINRQGEAIKQIDQRLQKLEGIEDPNNVD